MIIFEKIKYKNLLSTGNSFTEVILNENNLTLIVGDNGSGKSTIVDAITLGLYGKPFRKINKPQLVNSINGKGLVVEVEFSVGSKHYKVVRGIKPAIFELYLNDELINQDANSRDYQEMLEKQILKLNYKAFCQVVILGNASFVPFMQLAAGDRRLIIEELLDLQIFSTMNNLVKLKTNENKSLINECSTHIKINEEKIKLQKENQAKQGVFIQEQINEHQAKISELEESVNGLNMNIDKRLKLITTCKEKIVEEKDFDESINKLNEYNISEREFNNSLKTLKGELKFYETHNDCPTCKQDLDETFKLTTINSKLEQIGDIEKKLLLLQEKMSELHQVIKKNQVTKTINQQTNDNISSLKNSNLSDHNTINIYTKSIKEYFEKIDKLKAMMMEETSNDEQLKKFEKILVKLLEANTTMINKQNIYDVTAMILKDNGVKAQVIKQFVSIINQLINKYLADLGFFCQFELDETFTETIKSRHRDEFSYASFSEGEKMRINLAVLLTWRTIARMRNSASTNLLLMDEVFDSSLDAAGTDFFIKILNQLTNDTNVFIISHKGDQMIDQFENLIQFEKRKNFSMIRGD